MWDKLFAPIDLMQKGLEASWLRNAVIRDNIANAQTPDFKSSDVHFETIFARALSQNTGLGTKMTREGHIDFNRSDLSSLTARVERNDERSMRMDGNNVDIEAENVKLAQNSIFYNTVVYKLNSELARIKMAINEGR